MQRRELLKGATALTLGALAGAQQGDAAAAEIDVRPQEAGPTISKHIYGHFIEHLGGVIYDGIWVGRDSKIPNVAGIRRQFIDDMKRIAAPNLRWPGGCFADGYHWRDGIGDPARRPRTYNYWESRMPAGTRATETNQFGTHEFLRLCREVGAEPYLAANMASGTAQEFHDWVLYCNAPLGTVSLAEERGANGQRDPFRVRYWGVGNETWGCGGTLESPEYVPLYYRFTSQLSAYEPLYLVAVGPRGHNFDMDLNWTEGFFRTMGRRRPPDGYSVHYYTDFRRPGFRAGNFTPDEWYMVLHDGARTESVLASHWEVMGKYDKAHRCKMVVDEWGVWYSQPADLVPAYILSQVGTLRDAVHAAMTFDIFNRHADKVAMANIAQTINCIHSLFWGIEDRFLRTPTYYAFEMYKPHMEGRLVPMEIRAPELKVVTKDRKPAALAGLAGSASVQNNRLTVTLTNPSLENAVIARIRLQGAAAQEARGQVLTHADMRAANTFEKPGEVAPAALPVKLVQGGLEVTIPKQAVAALEVRIA
jgi:alpha-N-arabinofuranosidase